VTVRVGVRDLRENLRSWLDLVKEGEEIVVTERGKAIAQLTPLDSGRRTLEDLIARGLVRPPLRRKRLTIDVSKLPKLEGTGPTLSDILVRQRREGY
jgi:antitoxin (DNA-binding transcriptional repressor) of toxin-antitoxin stability system